MSEQMVQQIPPARIAHPAGEVVHDTGFDPGPASRGGLAMPQQQAPHPITARPSLTDAAQAQSQFAKIVGDLKSWVLDNPHGLRGEAAHLANFVRALVDRQMARATAEVHGQQITEDEIDTAQNLPPAEAYVLRDLAQKLINMHDLYEGVAKGSSLVLKDEVRAEIDRDVEAARSLLSAEWDATRGEPDDNRAYHGEQKEPRTKEPASDAAPKAK